ncbi:hypothetical protein [Eubacterium callanderi]|uniref:hypothetical protein n=1 Tax=Eubacterium callanderi TaxID=53442 RepID=UPI001C0FA5D2|nr:hypothetical protein [Eubacterium callanderi]MBU5305183.1 hypothetical protein [Eubacterium callanderi]
MNNKILVASVLDKKTLVLNIGSDGGVQKNQKFLIYALSDHEIIDPETKKSLGYLEIVKGRGRVTHVQPTMCTLESDEYRQTPKRRITKEGNSAMFDLTRKNNKEIEEIESICTIIPFENPKIGDYARLL